MKIVVAGATGTLGRRIVDAVRTAGHTPLSISRETGVDLISGSRLPDILSGASAVIDASATGSTKTKASVDFFGTVTRNLLDAEHAARVPHHVAISIIGAATVNANYYAGKATQEQILMSEPRPRWSLLRTTQFHEFVHQLLRAGRFGPFQVVPTLRSQPIAAAEVATELVDIATGEPRALVPDLAGPRPERFADLIRSYLARSVVFDGTYCATPRHALCRIGVGLHTPVCAPPPTHHSTHPDAARYGPVKHHPPTQQHRRVIEIPLPGAWGRGMRDGSLLPEPGARTGRQTFDQWLAEQPTERRS